MGWKPDLNRIPIVSNVCPVHSCLVVANCPHLQTELLMNTHTIISDMYQNGCNIRKDTDGQNQAVSVARAFGITH